MTLHDEEAMPLYEPTVTLKMKLRGRYDSTQLVSEADAVLIQQLDAAGDSMMVWMREFEQDFSGWPEDSAKRIVIVTDGNENIKTIVNASIAAAEERIGE